MEQVQNPALAVFQELNTRMGVLIGETLQKNAGTPNERKLMTALTNAGIESAEEVLVLINEGLTYEIWKEFLQKNNTLDGVLGMFENEAGDFAKIVNEFQTADLEPAFDEFMANGVFTVEAMQRDIDTLKQRLVWAEKMWAMEDNKAKEADVLTQVTKEIVDNHVMCYRPNC